LKSKGEDAGNGEQQRRSEAKTLKKELILLILCGGEKQVRTNNKQEEQTNRHAKNIIFIIFLNVFLAKQRASQTRTAAGKKRRVTTLQNWRTELRQEGGGKAANSCAIFTLDEGCSRIEGGIGQDTQHTPIAHQ